MNCGKKITGNSNLKRNKNFRQNSFTNVKAQTRKPRSQDPNTLRMVLKGFNCLWLQFSLSDNRLKDVVSPTKSTHTPHLKTLKHWVVCNETWGVLTHVGWCVDIDVGCADMLDWCIDVDVDRLILQKGWMVFFQSFRGGPASTQAYPKAIIS